jgi:hypothetical protein
MFFAIDDAIGTSVTNPLLGLEKKNRAVDSIIENGVFQISGGEGIIMGAALGSDREDFNVTQFSVAGIGEDNETYLILGGSRSVPQMVKANFPPNDGTTPYTVEGTAPDEKYVYNTGNIDEDDALAIPYLGDYAMSYYEALGEEIVTANNIQVTELPNTPDPLATYYRNLGLAVFITKLRDAKGSEVAQNLFTPGAIASSRTKLLDAQLKLD